MGVEILLHLFLISAVDGGEWSASCLGICAFWEKNLHCSLNSRLARTLK